MPTNIAMKRPVETRLEPATAQIGPTIAPRDGGRRPPDIPPRGQWPSSSDSVTKAPKRSLFDPAIARPALVESLRKLDPRHLRRNPVMLIVEIGAVVASAAFVRALLSPGVDPT
ncbi:MAG TPA: hypothetical protein VFI22_06740, partial [Thermomicrobiales bacterium]|nr:hypothetical protein [Thermomicrobiales bacterium]